MGDQTNPRNIVVGKLKNLIESNNHQIAKKKKLSEEEICHLCQSI